MKKYWFICMGGKKGQCEPYHFPAPAMLNNDAYVPADLAEEMLDVLKLFVDWEELERTSGDKTLIQTKLVRITNHAKSIIAKAEEL